MTYKMRPAGLEVTDGDRDVYRIYRDDDTIGVEDMEAGSEIYIHKDAVKFIVEAITKVAAGKA